MRIEKSCAIWTCLGFALACSPGNSADDCGSAVVHPVLGRVYGVGREGTGSGSAAEQGGCASEAERS
jgi:hypothetical protein